MDLENDMWWNQRLVRLFVSSELSDMWQERNVLSREVFPELRRRCRKCEVEFRAIDLVHGANPMDVHNLVALHRSLNEIDRCRPWFLGLLGERYGWVPKELDWSLIEGRPWLSRELGSSSVEIEILHGVFHKPVPPGTVFFYFRDPAGIEDVPEPLRVDLVEEDPAVRARLGALKDRIRSSGHHLVERFADPSALGALVLADLWNALVREFPELEDPAGSSATQLLNVSWDKSRPKAGPTDREDVGPSATRPADATRPASGPEAQAPLEARSAIEPMMPVGGPDRSIPGAETVSSEAFTDGGSATFDPVLDDELVIPVFDDDLEIEETIIEEVVDDEFTTGRPRRDRPATPHESHARRAVPSPYHESEHHAENSVKVVSVSYDPGLDENITIHETIIDAVLEPEADTDVPTGRSEAHAAPQETAPAHPASHRKGPEERDDESISKEGYSASHDDSLESLALDDHITIEEAIIDEVPEAGERDDEPLSEAGVPALHDDSLESLALDDHVTSEETADEGSGLDFTSPKLAEAARAGHQGEVEPFTSRSRTPLPRAELTDKPGEMIPEPSREPGVAEGPAVDAYSEVAGLERDAQDTASSEVPVSRVSVPASLMRTPDTSRETASKPVPHKTLPAEPQTTSEEGPALPSSQEDATRSLDDEQEDILETLEYDTMEGFPVTDGPRLSRQLEAKSLDVSEPEEEVLPQDFGLDDVAPAAKAGRTTTGPAYRKEEFIAETQRRGETAGEKDTSISPGAPPASLPLLPDSPEALAAKSHAVANAPRALTINELMEMTPRTPSSRGPTTADVPICLRYCGRTMTIFRKGRALPAIEEGSIPLREHGPRGYLEFFEGTGRIGAIPVPTLEELDENPAKIEVSATLQGKELEVKLSDPASTWKQTYRAPLAERDRVDFSVFAPGETNAGDTFLVQSFIHLPAQGEQARSMAEEADQAAETRASRSLRYSIERGSGLTLHLKMPGLDVDDPVQEVLWNGEPQSSEFVITVPRTFTPGPVAGTITVSRRSVPIGCLKFVVKVVSKEQAAFEGPPAGGLGRSFRAVFHFVFRSGRGGSS